MRDKLTVKAIERWSANAKRTGKAVYVWDTSQRGFGAWFSGRTVSWVFQVWQGGKGGKAKRITLGRYPEVDLDEARRLAIEARKTVNDGEELVSALKLRITKERERLASPRLDETIALFVKMNGQPGRYWPEVERKLRRDLLQPLGENIQLDGITTAKVRKIVEDRQATHPGAARTLYSALRPFFNWCVQRELLTVSPLEKVANPKPLKARDRVLSDAELKSVWNACTQLGWPWGHFHKTLILTAQRREETAGMRLSELNFDKGEWTIPKERTKNGKEHLVHLSPQCIDVLKDIPRQNSDLVFTTTGTTSISGYHVAKKQIDDLMPEGTPHWVVHDLRRTAASGMAALGFQPHVIERVLNHISGAQGGLVGVYQRHQYVEERRQALIAWGNYIAQLVC